MMIVSPLGQMSPMGPMDHRGSRGQLVPIELANRRMAGSGHFEFSWHSRNSKTTTNSRFSEFKKLSEKKTANSGFLQHLPRLGHINLELVMIC